MPTIFHRPDRNGLWLAYLECRSDGEARHWLPRCHPPGEYRIGLDTPLPTDEPEHVVPGKPKPPKRKKRQGAGGTEHGFDREPGRGTFHVERRRDG